MINSEKPIILPEKWIIHPAISVNTPIFTNDAECQLFNVIAEFFIRITRTIKNETPNTTCELNPE